MSTSAYVRSTTNALAPASSTRPARGSNVKAPAVARRSGAISDVSEARSGPGSVEYAPRVSNRSAVGNPSFASSQRASPGSGDVVALPIAARVSSSTSSASNDPVHGAQRSQRSPVQSTGAPPAPPNSTGWATAPAIGVVGSNTPSGSMSQASLKRRRTVRGRRDDREGTSGLERHVGPNRSRHEVSWALRGITGIRREPLDGGHGVPAGVHAACDEDTRPTRGAERSARFARPRGARRSPRGPFASQDPRFPSNRARACRPPIPPTRSVSPVTSTTAPRFARGVLRAMGCC